MTKNAVLAGLTALVLAAVAVSGCDRVSRREPPPDRYACDDGQSFQARFASANSTVWVTLPTHAFRMARAEIEPRVEVTPEGEVIEVEPAPDGEGEMKFTAGDNTLTIDDGAATLRLSNGNVYRNCRQAGGDPG